MKNPSVSVIIVSYNTKDLLLACIKSIRQAVTTNDNWEVIVVDNASADDSVKAMSNIKDKNLRIFVIRNKENLGFAKANNIGIRSSKGKYLLLLNSDTEVYGDTIGAMIRFMENHPRAGVATCKLILSDGTIDPACHRGFPTPWASFTYFAGLERLFPRMPAFSQYHLWFKNMNEAHQIDSPSGAFFLVRRDIMDEVGLLDEGYFMYGEDLDWAYRIKQKGWEIWYNPKVTTLHRKKQSGRSSGNVQVKKRTAIYFYETMRQFYRKHYQKTYGGLFTFIVNCLLSLRIFVVKTFSI